MSPLEHIRRAALPLSMPFTAAAFRSLAQALSTRELILLGEATHGTAEFYQARIEITKQLIRDQAIAAIAIEGDWPSAYRVNRYVRGHGTDATAIESLDDFKRFPLWMWRNTVVLEFVEWLRQHNATQTPAKRVGFYGLDMYSMYESIAAMLEYFDQVDPDMAQHVRKLYGCLDHSDDPQAYGHAVNRGRRPSCEGEVVELLVQLRERSRRYAKAGDAVAEDELFEVEQNARLVESAERYYRKMFDGRTDTWNLRDSHMLETLHNLQDFLSRRNNGKARLVVWAHNSHIGDARATYMSTYDQHNLGQLVRESAQVAGRTAALVGFTTYSGTVTAASEWDAPAECKRVRPGLPGSVESLFHNTGIPAFLLPIAGQTAELLEPALLQRAIGVLYLPGSERLSHYFSAHVARQFDWLIHIDLSSALEPLDAVSEWSEGEQQTYPFGV